MLFSSVVFLFTFLPIMLVLYYLVPEAYKRIIYKRGAKETVGKHDSFLRVYKNIVVLTGSLIFYAWGEPVYIFLMVFSILLIISADWILRGILRVRRKQEQVLYLT